MLWGIVAFLVLCLVVTWVWILRRPQESSLTLIQQQLNSLTDQPRLTMSEATSTTGREINQLHQRVDQRLSETAKMIEGTHRTVGERIDQNTKVFGTVQAQLGRLEEMSKGIQNVGKEISQLQEILHAPKLRGNLGELFLEELLAQILPRQNFEMQYGFKNGEKVDAVIKLAGGNMVPIDAKFPLENFRRMITANLTEAQEKEFRKAFASDFKKHVDNISTRYIRPHEGTLDFALLYVPAENVYYEAILRDERFGESLGINTYALNKRVIPVSPNSLYAYLQAIVLGLKGLKIEEKAKDIYSFLSRIRTELVRLEEEFGLVGKHLTNATSAFDKSEKRLERVQGRMAELDGSDTETPALPDGNENKIIKIQ